MLLIMRPKTVVDNLIAHYYKLRPPIAFSRKIAQICFGQSIDDSYFDELGWKSFGMDEDTLANFVP